MHVHKGTGPSGSLSFVSEKVPCLTQCVGSWTARSRLRTDMIMTIITMTVYIIDKNKGTKTAIVTDLPEATRMVSLGCTINPTSDKEPDKAGQTYTARVTTATTGRIAKASHLTANATARMPTHVADKTATTSMKHAIHIQPPTGQEWLAQHGDNIGPGQPRGTRCTKLPCTSVPSLSTRRIRPTSPQLQATYATGRTRHHRQHDNTPKTATSRSHAAGT